MEGRPGPSKRPEVREPGNNADKMTTEMAGRGPWSLSLRPELAGGCNPRSKWKTLVPRRDRNNHLVGVLGLEKIRQMNELNP